MSGCATASYLPALSNVKNYSKCSPVYSRHTPADVSKLRTVMDAVKKNPSLLEKAVPTDSIINTVGKNAPQIGTGVASMVTAIKGDISVASVISSAVMGSLTALTDARSESKDQDRVDVCMGDDADFVYFKDKDVTLVMGKQTESKTALMNSILNKNIKVEANKDITIEEEK